MDSATKNFFKVLAILIVVYLSAFLLSLRCDGNFSSSCLLERQAAIGSDFYWNYNTIKYVASHWVMPVEVDAKADGGIDGSVIRNEGRIMWHAPLYYYLAALLVLFGRLLTINEIVILVFLSVLIMLATNVLFFLFVRRVSYSFDKLRTSERFVNYSTLIFAFLPMNLYLSFFVNNDPLFYLFLIFSLLLFHRLWENKTYKSAILFGLFLGIGFLSRIAIIIVLIALFVYAVSLHFRKKYLERNLMLIPLLISTLMGSYTLIRNFLVFGRVLGDAILPLQQILTIFPRVLAAFWGGIYGNLSQISALVLISAIFLSLSAFYGVVLYLKGRKDYSLSLVLLVGVINLILLVHFVCNFSLVFRDLSCMGSDAQSRLILSLNPLIAIFSGLALASLRRNFLRLVFIVSMLFSIDFLFAFL